jgi:hypothetical protein
MQLGSEQHAKTLRQNRARIVSSRAEYAQVQRVAKRIEAMAGHDTPHGRAHRATASDQGCSSHHCRRCCDHTRIREWLPEAEHAYKPAQPS